MVPNYSLQIYAVCIEAYFLYEELVFRNVIKMQRILENSDMLFLAV
jgi:hypothetical protein